MRDGSIRLGDFGVAKILESTMEQAHTVIGEYALEWSRRNIDCENALGRLVWSAS